MKPPIKRLLIGGIICTVIPPALGAIVTVFGMIRAFKSLGDSGISDPHALAQSVSAVLIATWAGLIVGIVGLIITITAVILHFTTLPKKVPANREM